MAEVVPFRPWLYNAGIAGSLDKLLAPPYDVIGPELQDQLYAASPANVVRVDLNRQPDAERRYAEAAQTMRDWKSSRVLTRPDHPQATVLEHTFVGPDGRKRVRTGILAAVQLADFDDRIIFPHEFTLSGPKEDRFRLMLATEMALSPVFLLYEGAGRALAEGLAATVQNPPDSVASAPSARPEDGGQELLRIWHSRDGGLLRALTAGLAGKPLVIADGHHRYETALRYRDWRREKETEQGRSVPPDAASEHFLAYLVDIADPGLAIFATHRLLRDLSSKQLALLPKGLSRWFSIEELSGGEAAGGGPASGKENAEEKIRRFLDHHSSGAPALGLYLPHTGRSYGLRLTVDPADRRCLPVRPGGGANGQPSADALSLDVSVLQNFVLDGLLGITTDSVARGQNVAFVTEWGEAFALLESGDCQAGFFLNPTRLDQVEGMAFRGERMPQKSTYFYPKVPTGLVFLDLKGSL